MPPSCSHHEGQLYGHAKLAPSYEWLGQRRYWQAMELELKTLLGKDAWAKVDPEDDMNVLPSTWDFKCKRFPDGLV